MSEYIFNSAEQAFINSCHVAKDAIAMGITDIEKVAFLAHEGWSEVASADYFGKLPVKEQTSKELKDSRFELAKKDYTELADDEKEKYRILARIFLKPRKV
jgi:hypothetical protein